MGAAMRRTGALDWPQSPAQVPGRKVEEANAVAHVEVDPDAVAGTASQIASASDRTSAPSGTITPAAPDPVSTAVAQTLAARMTAIEGYTAAAAAITSTRAAMVAASGAGYQAQEAANTSAVGGD